MAAEAQLLICCSQGLLVSGQLMRLHWRRIWRCRLSSAGQSPIPHGQRIYTGGEMESFQSPNFIPSLKSSFRITTPSPAGFHGQTPWHLYSLIPPHWYLRKGLPISIPKLILGQIPPFVSVKHDTRSSWKKTGTWASRRLLPLGDLFGRIAHFPVPSAVPQPSSHSTQPPSHAAPQHALSPPTAQDIVMQDSGWAMVLSFSFASSIKQSLQLML